jgi:hypothetical protein
MKALVFVALLISGCATDNVAVLPASRPVFESIVRHKRDDPKHFSFLYGWIDLSDGANAEEALAIAQLYFDNMLRLEGALVDQKRVRGNWRFQGGVGYGGTPIRPIWVDAKTGSVWQEGGERIDHIAELLRSEPNQMPEPTPPSVTPAAGQPSRRP